MPLRGRAARAARAEQQRVGAHDDRGSGDGERERRGEQQRIGRPAADRAGVEDGAAAVELPEQHAGEHDRAEVEIVALEDAARGRPRLLALGVDDAAAGGEQRRQQHRAEHECRAGGGEQRGVVANGCGQRCAAGERLEGRRAAERGDRARGEPGPDDGGRHGQQQALHEREAEDLRCARAAAAEDGDLLGLALADAGHEHDDVERDDAGDLQQDQQQRHLREGLQVAEPRELLGDRGAHEGGRAELVADVGAPRLELVDGAGHVADGQRVEVGTMPARCRVVSSGNRPAKTPKYCSWVVSSAHRALVRVRQAAGNGGPDGHVPALAEELPAGIFGVARPDEADHDGRGRDAHECGGHAAHLVPRDLGGFGRRDAPAVVVGAVAQPHHVAEGGVALEAVRQQDLGGRALRVGEAAGDDLDVVLEAAQVDQVRGPRPPQRLAAGATRHSCGGEAQRERARPRLDEQAVAEPADARGGDGVDAVALRAGDGVAEAEPLGGGEGDAVARLVEATVEAEAQADVGERLGVDRRGGEQGGGE